MIANWDDIRYFLAVARGGSVRAGADELGVKHSTVLRRIAQLEARLGVRAFDRLPSGYRLTDAGREVVAFAEQMEVASRQLETRVLGRDERARGPIRVTMASMLATHLLMHDLAEFASLHPEIEVEVVCRDEFLNLTNREADIAIRVVRERAMLPENLHAAKGPEVFGSVYLSRGSLAAWEADRSAPVRWVFREFDGIPAWCRRVEIPIAGVVFKTADAGAHIAAIRAGVGMSALPCFVGDADPTLVRAPGASRQRYGTMWLLTHGETRRTKRIQLFVRFMARRLGAYASLLAG